jgi:pyruvate dehydrogenase E1 component alpha subunit
VDGNDVLAVHQVTSRAAEWVRSGSGPAFVEAVTYRMAGHSTSDDPTRYRSPAEVDLWQTRDPLHRLRTFLLSRSTPQAFFDDLEAEADQLAEATRGALAELGDPQASRIFDHVYAELHPLIEEERTQHTAYLEVFADQ